MDRPKKGRVSERTRPEPTFFGNCESWDFIVGKKRPVPGRHRNESGFRMRETTCPPLIHRLTRCRMAEWH